MLFPFFEAPTMSPIAPGFLLFKLELLIGYELVSYIYVVYLIGCFWSVVGASGPWIAQSYMNCSACQSACNNDASCLYYEFGPNVGPMPFSSPCPTFGMILLALFVRNLSPSFFVFI